MRFFHIFTVFILAILSTINPEEPYKPISSGSNIYEIEGPFVLGQEIVRFRVFNGIIGMVIVLNYFKNHEDLFNWFDRYYNEAKELNYKGGHVDKGMFFMDSLENKAMSFTYEFTTDDDIMIFSGELIFTDDNVGRKLGIIKN